jgi:hypothetical protein
VNDSEITPVAPIVTSIAFICTFHMRCITIARYSYFRIFSASYFTTFLSPEIPPSINTCSFFDYHGLWCPGYC